MGLGLGLGIAYLERDPGWPRRAGCAAGSRASAAPERGSRGKATAVPRVRLG